MKVRPILREFSNKSALVVGDICLDRWCTYDPDATELSRETGLPRIGVVSTECTPGAAGTVASNLVSLGVSRVAVLGVIGDDGSGYELVRALTNRQISAELIHRTKSVCTFTYTKLINAKTGIEDMPRVDYIVTQPMPEDVDRQIAARLEAFFDSFDVIIVSDQAETETGGVVTPMLRDEISRLAAERPERVVWVDSRVRAELFRSTILKPNRTEAEAACLRAFGKVDLERFREWTRSPFVTVTDGANGATVVEAGRSTQLPAVAVPVVDICGAGDSFSAGAAMAYAVTRDPVTSAKVGNLVASVTVTKKGTGVATVDEVIVAAEKIA